MNPVDSFAHDGSTANTTPANPINDPGVENRQGLNTFDLTAQNAFTARYGEITPYFYSVGVPDDRTTLQPSHMLRTYTFGSPLLSTMRMHVQNFSVPLSAIMPNTWDLIYKNPVKGNDVPNSALCSLDIAKLQLGLFTRLGNLYSEIASASSIPIKVLLSVKALPYLMLYYNAFSVGGLLHYLGISSNFEDDVLDIDRRFDAAFDALMQTISSLDSNTELFAFWLDTDAYFVRVYPTRSSVRMFLSYALDNPETFVTATQGWTSGINATFSNALVNFVTELCNFSRSDKFTKLDSLTVSRTVNIYKLAAYQMTCAQYFSNDHVDDIYTSKLWLQNMRALVLATYGGSVTYNQIKFDYNGVSIEYDTLSSQFLERMSKYIGNTNALEYGLYFWNNLLTFKRSLKYGDYFNSARTQPLAVGDVTAPVVGKK